MRRCRVVVSIIQRGETTMKVRAIAIAALLSVAMPAAVLAQANTTSATPNTGVNAGAGVSAGSSANASGMNADSDFNAFLQALETADYTSATGDLSTSSSFNVVKLSSMANADATKLQEALGAHQQDIASLTGWVNTNAQAKAALEAEGLSPDDVVWAGSNSGGGVVLYVNDLDASGATSGAMSGGAATKTQ
jgi:hypothetical protein